MMVLRGDELSSTSGLTLDFGGRNTEEKYVLKSSAFAASCINMLSDKLFGKKTVVSDNYLFVSDNVRDWPLIFRLARSTAQLHETEWICMMRILVMTICLLNRTWSE
jgi:hypothetical protein